MSFAGYLNRIIGINTDGSLCPGVERELAVNLLEACGNSLEMAVNMHMENGEGDPVPPPRSRGVYSSLQLYILPHPCFLILIFFPKSVMPLPLFLA